MIQIGIIGYGYWGPNLVRNFSAITGAGVKWICDTSKSALLEAKKLYPTVRTTQNYQALLDDAETQAIVIATPVSTHFPLAVRAIRAGKHVLVEKPLTLTARDAQALVRLAKTGKRTLMVDHTYVYTPAIQKIKEIIDSNELGEIYHLDCVRTNLGLVQKDSNVIYDLATHDLSIVDYLLGSMPTRIAATGSHRLIAGQEPVAHIVAHYGRASLDCHVSWLSPVKIRTMVIVGTQKMLLYDDMQASEKVKVYDRGIDVTPAPADLYQLRIGYRLGSVSTPSLPIREGLVGVTHQFIKSITTGVSGPSDGPAGARIVLLLTSANKSLSQNGKSIAL